MVVEDYEGKSLPPEEERGQEPKLLSKTRMANRYLCIYIRIYLCVSMRYLMYICTSSLRMIQVDVFDTTEKVNRQVDLYRDGSSKDLQPRRSDGAMMIPHPRATSYMFCPEVSRSDSCRYKSTLRAFCLPIRSTHPAYLHTKHTQAYGMMSEDLADNYWQIMRGPSEEAAGVGGTGEAKKINLSTAAFAALNGKEAAGGAPAIVLPAAQQQGGMQEEEGLGGGSSASVSMNDAPYLVLLVPSGAVDWGHQHQGGGPDASSSSYGPPDPTQWLEVGCRLTSMRVVNDVKFTV